MKTFLMPLNAEEEIYYLKKMKEGDLEAKYILIERNLRLVAHIAKKYQSAEEDTEDLISIGTIGLIKAVSTFKYEKGNRLATYAARCIEMPETETLDLVLTITSYSCIFGQKRKPPEKFPYMNRLEQIKKEIRLILWMW